MPNRPSIGSMSIGRPWVHGLPEKLKQAANYGFEGIELFYDDLDCLAHTHHGGCIVEAARHTRRICDSLHLEIVNIQPFSFYEGLLDRAEHERMITEKLSLWFLLVRILGTDVIQVPANFLQPDPVTGAPRTTGDINVIVSDLQLIADLGLKQSPPVRFAYESLCWSNHIDTWEKCWEVVQLVNRPNFGICLDTFNIAGRIYADPASPTGKTPNADREVKASISRLVAAIDPAKVYFVQVVDAERLSRPLVKGHDFYNDQQPSRMSWSRNARLFAFEEERGGYLPVIDIARGIAATGFEGWWSLELFSRTLADPTPSTLKEHARRGMDSYRKLERTLRLNEQSLAGQKQHRL
ncbi:hypothetical protein AJ80_02612 [Polytolypa hystricis UAMH7299]|uniref:Xylose isomerase-like TIM barrel domain-containing protein n=1 Tax=Polytolypa hystricis (strain UAMH7299) TaxID=1447883 RepID=A0A2B7YQQ8_POLH7|nr:hypothetical protein AJ80_02612 [Polytolypa hystricis UAMH7299]